MLPICRESINQLWLECSAEELTNLRMYVSKRLYCRNAISVKTWQVRQSKNPSYEMPHGVTGTVEPAGTEQKPKAECKDRIIGTRKGVER